MGKQVVEIDSRGKGHPRVETGGQPGYDVVLTIDADLQRRSRRR